MKRFFLAVMIVSATVADVYCMDSMVESLNAKYQSAMLSNSAGEIHKHIREFEKAEYTGIGKSISSVFIGSLFSKAADLDILFWNKLLYVDKGIKMMKTGMAGIAEAGAGVLSDKELLTMHLVYGITSGYIPGNFQPREIGIHELETAVGMKDFPNVDKRTMVEAYTLLSEGYRETKNAEKSGFYRDKAVSLSESIYLEFKKKAP